MPSSMTQTRRDCGVDYYLEWQRATARLAAAKKQIAALTAANMGAESVPVCARDMFKAFSVLACAAIAHYKRLLADEPEDSHKASVLRGQIASAQRWEQTLKWFSDESEERNGK